MSFARGHGNQAPGLPPQDETQEVFRKLKAICVPLLGNSHLNYQSTLKVLSSLSDLIRVLKELDKAKVEMRPSLLSYVFFPLSTILGRNAPSDIPDQVLEKVFITLQILFDHWWWNCDMGIWEQVFMLAGAILGGREGKEKGNGKERDDETKEAAARLMLELLRDRSADLETISTGDLSFEKARARLVQYQVHSQTSRFIPIMGQTLTSLLSTARSPHMQLQLVSLQLIEIITGTYLPGQIIPSILPGVVSAMTNIALGRTNTRGKGWTNGALAACTLKVLEVVIIRALGDDICIAEGLVKELNDLEDIRDMTCEAEAIDSSAQPPIAQSYATARTAAWLRGTTSQLLIALNALTPLVSHPTASALLALASLAHRLLSESRLTLPQLHPLLLSFLLSLSRSHFDSVSNAASVALRLLLTPPSKARHVLLEILLQNAAENLAALPRLLSARADTKIEYLAGQIEAVCSLGCVSGSHCDRIPAGLNSVRSGIGKLLGPTGRIEKWGWSLLAVLEFAPPVVSVTRASEAQLMLESDLGFVDQVAFPEVTLRHMSSRTTHIALERMLRALGQAGGDDCLFSVEWFVDVGRGGQTASATAALWCACRILEGVAGISLEAGSSGDEVYGKGKKLEKFARWITRSVADLWNMEEEDDDQPVKFKPDDDDGQLSVEFTKGLYPIQIHLDAKSRPEPTVSAVATPPFLHKVFLLQLACIASAILQARYIPLLLHALYPILHSLVSPVSHLSSTALSALQYVTNCTAYATPANLLLSNFDYALDSVSRRLSRRWLDVDATKVLVLLVRLIGRDVVQRAGDIVEECFDRLDDFHGYDVIVEGLLEGLLEVVKVVELEDRPQKDTKYQFSLDESAKITDGQRMDAFLGWLDHWDDSSEEEASEEFGPAPREAWGQRKGKKTNTEDDGQENKHQDEPDPLTDPAPTPTQALTQQIVSRSLYFLTHGSPLIRARILTLLSSSVPVLSESALLPSVNRAWPFILNRMSDSESFVVSSAATLVEVLAIHVGSFMTTRVWDDVWPRFRKMLQHLDEADSANALARRGVGAVGTESAYTHSHRLYRSLLRTMSASVKGVQIQDAKAWDVMIGFRRFLHRGAHEELQSCARDLYVALGENNEDALWLVLSSTARAPGENVSYLEHLMESKWDIKSNVSIIFATLTASC